MPRPIHFEIPAVRPERAIEFYSKVFGREFHSWAGPMPYWLVRTGDDGSGIDGGLLPRQSPAQGTVNRVEIPSCDEYVRKIEAAGRGPSVDRRARSAPRIQLSGEPVEARPRQRHQ